MRAELGEGATLTEAVAMARRELGLKGGEGVLRLVSRFPVKRMFSEDGEEMARPLAALGLGKDVSLVVGVEGVTLPGVTDKAATPKASVSVSGKAQAKAKAKGGSKKTVHTLYSEGYLHEEQTKGNRYYGGGSTLIEAWVEEGEGEGEAPAATPEEGEGVAEGEEAEERGEWSMEVGLCVALRGHSCGHVLAGPGGAGEVEAGGDEEDEEEESAEAGSEPSPDEEEGEGEGLATPSETR
jgi:hypothetical protein